MTVWEVSIIYTGAMVIKHPTSLHFVSSVVTSAGFYHLILYFFDGWFTEAFFLEMGKHVWCIACMHVCFYDNARHKA